MLRRDEYGRFARAPRSANPPRPWEPAAAEVLANPTEQYPRYRLRVFDLCWPWRATRGEAFEDAKLSGNATWDPNDRLLYLDACADIQRDPPSAMQRYELRRRRAARS